MSRRIRRPHMISAVMLTTLAAATGCASVARHQASPDAATKSSAQPRPASSPTSRAAPPATNQLSETLPTVANGGSTVMIGGRAVQFGSTVTDASWSPDGSRLAYIDGNGNIATALADGSDVVVLTRTNSKVKRAHPTWESGGRSILFTERGVDGVWRLTTVNSNGSTATRSEQPVYNGDGPSAEDTAPNAVSKLDVSTGLRSIDLVTYQHRGKTGPEVWIMDRNQREPVPLKVGAGSEPVLAPDGRSVAFVGAGGQLFVELVVGHKTTMPVQLTRGIAGLSDPAWSPDGARIAFRTKTNVESVSAKLPSGGNDTKANPARVESTRPGSPAYRPRAVTATYRVDTADPIASAIALSQSRWATRPTSGNLTEGPEWWAAEVTLVDTSDPGAAVTEMQSPSGPVLYVHGNSLDPRVRAEIGRVMNPSSGTVTLVGGVSAGVASAVKSMGYPVQRKTSPPPMPIGGLSGAPGVVVISDRDAVAIANYRLAEAATSTWSVMFVDGTTLRADQHANINSLASNATVYALGADATAALNQSWSGKPRINLVSVTAIDSATESLRMATAFAAGPTCVALVPTTSWQAQLLAATTNCAVLFIDPKRGLSPDAAKWLRTSAGSVAGIFAFGGPAMISDASLHRAAAAVSGPGGYADKSLPRLR
jgi:WD40-like Beta Propeller Repeat